jgi:putative ABC transport system permease protein
MLTVVTRQNLFAEKTRLAISVGGVAFAVFLISLLLAFYQGWQANVGRFVDEVDADIWVTREGTTDFLNAASILPASMEQELASIDGVERVDAIIVRPMQFDVPKGGVNGDTHLVGYEVGNGAGGPSERKEGAEAPPEGGIIVDHAFAKKSGVGVGDTVGFRDEDLEVVGISKGGDFVFSQTTFVSLDTASELLDMDTLRTFFLLSLNDSADEAQVIQDVRDTFPGVGAISSDEFAAATRDRVMRNITPILVVILFLAFVVGVAVTGLTIYNATVEKAREFGILKAIGFTNSYLFRVVFEQSLLTSLFGFILGVALMVVTARFASAAVPQFVTLVRLQDILLVLGTTLMMGVIAGFFPVRRIASVDPVKVFQA